MEEGDPRQKRKPGRGVDDAFEIRNLKIEGERKETERNTERERDERKFGSEEACRGFFVATLKAAETKVRG
jgi:hypothetical protein